MDILLKLDPEEQAAVWGKHLRPELDSVRKSTDSCVAIIEKTAKEFNDLLEVALELNISIVATSGDYCQKVASAELQKTILEARKDKHKKADAFQNQYVKAVEAASDEVRV